MNDVQALEFLGQIRLSGTKLGLENVRALAERLGNPQDRLRFLHIAGTNGKGSVAAFLDSALRAGGYRVGLYTSPHLISFGERIRVDFVPMSASSMAEGLTEIRLHVEAMTAEGQAPTYFEVVVVLALWEFARREVDWVVWETGLGGRLDATNIVTPEVSLITRIGLDHTAWLGDTLAKIAAEKAGIIKPGVPVVIAPQRPEAMTVIQAKAQGVSAPFFPVKEDSIRATAAQPLGLRGEHQITNAALAKTALHLLHEHGAIELTNDQLDRGLAEAHWPGRLDLIALRPPLLVDGAHNEDAMAVTVQTWKEQFDRLEKPLVVVGFLQDKPVKEMLDQLATVAGEFHFVGVKSGRAMPVEELPGLLPQPIPHSASPSLRDAWPVIVQARQDKRPVLITGSLFLAGEALALWEGREDELGLNERLGPANP